MQNDINENIRMQLRRANEEQQSINVLKEFGIYDLYYSRKLYETESVNKNDWNEVKDLLGQLGKVTGRLISKLLSIGKRKTVELCVKAAKNIYQTTKDNGEAIRYLFYSLLFFVVGYTGNMMKERYNEKPIIPGTHIEYETKNGVDTMTVTNQRGGEFAVKQPDADKAPVIVSIKKSDTTKDIAKVKLDNMSPIRLLNAGEKHPSYYHVSPEILRAVAEVESFVDHIYDAKSGTRKAIRKADMMDMKKDLTIGYGHKLTKEERKTMAFNTKWTKQHAFEVFKKDAKSHEQILNNCLKQLPYYDKVEFSQGAIDGFFSIFFNAGSGNMTGTATRAQSEFWKRLGNCRIDKENHCVNKADVYFTISQLRHQNITEPGHVARRNAECLIAQQLGNKIDPKLYNLKQ